MKGVIKLTAPESLPKLETAQVQVCKAGRGGTEWMHESVGDSTKF